MTDRELENWFWDKFNSCYPVLHDKDTDNIYWFYDKSYIRKSKLNKLNNEDITLPSTIKGECYFYQNKNRKFLTYDYNNIYKFIQKNHSRNYSGGQKFIDSILKHNDILQSYISTSANLFAFWTIKDTLKLSVYTEHQKYYMK